MEANKPQEPDKSSSSPQPSLQSGPASGPPQPEPTAATPPATAVVPDAAGKPSGGKPEDKLCWQSDDGLVSVCQKVNGAGRFPPHNYPVVVLKCIARAGTRIRQIPNGLEILLAHHEVERFLEALTAADGKVRYEVSRRVPPKDPARKAYWDRINAARHQRRAPGEDGAQGGCH